jgi:thiamine kinase-like enzyme
MRDELVALENLLEWPSDLQTCHRDLFADNVLRTPTGSVSVIDWENAGLADPSQELGLVLFEFSCGQATRARDLYDAYRDNGGPGRIDRPGNFSMVIAQISHIGEISCARWLDPARRDQQERNTGRVQEFVTEAITRQMISDLLDAVT